jgi:hypothetical protein
MKFSDLNNNLIGKKVKLVSLKNSGLLETDVIQKNKIYKIFDINKNFFDRKKLTIQLIDSDYNSFWVNHYDVELVEENSEKDEK